MNHLAATLVSYVSPTGEPLLTPSQVAARLTLSVGYISACRCDKNHALKFVKIDKHIFYLESDVNAFLAARQAKKAGK